MFALWNGEWTRIVCHKLYLAILKVLAIKNMVGNGSVGAGTAVILNPGG